MQHDQSKETQNECAETAPQIENAKCVGVVKDRLKEIKTCA